MRKPSEEQQLIIDCVKNGDNILVDAVAGSGKTTTVLFLAQQVNKRITLFTYNSKLKSETRERVSALGLKNIEVHSYHSFGVSHYVNPCVTDTDLINILKYNYPLKNSFNSEIIILDETQDMTPLYFKFVHKAIVDMCKMNCNIVVLGDNMQCIYNFPQKGADLRFLTMADYLYESPFPWKKLGLKTSYRITKPMEYFINEVVLGYPRMKSIKDSDNPVHYITGDIFQKVPEHLFKEISNLLKQYKADDIFVLAPSIRSRNELNPIKQLENLLVKRGIPCYVPLSDDEDLKDEVLVGKVVFSSFHQSKGLERKVVFVYNFNNSYFKFYARENDTSICPNTMYVALTRALERLYVVAEGNDSTAFSFLKLHKMNDMVKRVMLDAGKAKADSPRVKDDKLHVPMRRVTDLTRFLPDELSMNIVELCKMELIRTPYKSINIPDSIVTKEGLVEMIYELNGTAIPTIYEHRLTGQISIWKDLQEHFACKLERDRSSDVQFMKEKIQSVLNIPKTSADYLKLANVYSAYISGYIYKIAQIKNYSWFSDETIEELYSVLKDTIGAQGEDSLFEETLEETYRDVLICGRADLIDNSALWELKCVSNLKAEHYIQLALYAWIWQSTCYNVKGRRRFLLHNIRTGEVLELKGIENLEYIVNMVLDNHFRVSHTISDEEFLKQCNDHSLGYIDPHVSTMQCLIVD